MVNRFSALVVHEQPSVLRGLVELLSGDALCVETAQSPGEALVKLVSRDYALLLVAHCPPTLDGYLLLERCRGLAPGALCVLLTDGQEDGAGARGRQDLHHLVIRDVLGAQGRSRLVALVGECVRLLGYLEDQRSLVARLGHAAEVQDASAMGEVLLGSMPARGGPVFDELEPLYQRVRATSRQTVLSLVEAIEAKDPYTKGHCGRVATYTLALAQEIGYPSAELEILELGAFLHDIGKIGIRDAVLRKPGPLDEDEWQHMREHVLLGCDIVSKIDVLEAVMPAVRCHHERWDGSGYPDGLEGERIPLIGRLVAIADAYDAMATDRPYKDALPLETCEHLLRRTGGTMYDPFLTEIFIERRLGALYRPDYDDLELFDSDDGQDGGREAD